jgi:glyoxylase-like metal-dependent hydrolase (beta-lactamase superfamily II)
MIPYVREMEVAYGHPAQLTPLVTRVLAENPGPFTFHGTGTYLVGRNELAVIDPGPLLDSHLQALVEAIGDRRVSHILVTHTHLDHSPLADPLRDLTGAPVIGLPAPTRAGAALSAQDGAFRPDEAATAGRVFAGDGWTLEVLATPGHASNHVGYALRQENGFFCGDHIMGWSTTVVSPPDGDMGEYYASLDRVHARRFSVLWPTHGPPITDVDAFIEGYREHRRQRETQILRELGRGPRRISELTPRLYMGVDVKRHDAAGRSLWAHLIQLAREGRVSVEGEPSEDAVWSLPRPRPQSRL